MEGEFLKIHFVHGLWDIVSNELSRYPQFQTIKNDETSAYLDFRNKFDISIVLGLKSITNAFLSIRNSKYHPLFLSNHKSILGNMIKDVKELSTDRFKTFRLSCAGSDSEEVISIKKFLEREYDIFESEDADMKISVGKMNDGTWELNVEITSRPLSFREYKVEHIEGAMNPTIAYALNSLCDLESKSSYVNPCSGSATLLIEAADINPKLSLVGFDNDKTKISLAIQNIKKAGLIKAITLKLADLLDKPYFGTFDVIASDLPFGMHISKGENLEKLYSAFVDFSEATLSEKGILAVYTTEHKPFIEALNDSSFVITKEFPLRILTNVNSYIYPKMYICKRK